MLITSGWGDGGGGCCRAWLVVGVCLDRAVAAGAPPPLLQPQSVSNLDWRPSKLLKYGELKHLNFESNLNFFSPRFMRLEDIFILAESGSFTISVGTDSLRWNDS